MLKRNLLVIGFVALVISAMVVTGARNSRRSARASDGGTLAPNNNIGKLAPDFQLAALNGQDVKLSNYRGRAVLLNFWATWCGPCKIEMPWFIEMQKRYKEKGFEVIGVAMDDSGKDVVEKFTREIGVNYTVLMGKEAVGDAYGGVMGLPTTFYIDRNGRIVEQESGLIGRGEIEDNIKKTLEVPFLPSTSTASDKGVSGAK